MLQFKVNTLAKIMSEATTQTITIELADGSHYVIQLSTDADHYHELEARLLWTAMHSSDLKDAMSPYHLIDEVAHVILMSDVEFIEGTWVD